MELKPRWGTPHFKWQGRLKDFLGLKFSIPYFFLGGGGVGGMGGKTIWQVYFWVAWIKKGFLGGIQDSKFANTSNRD